MLVEILQVKHAVKQVCGPNFTKEQVVEHLLLSWRITPGTSEITAKTTSKVFLE